jgi:flagellar basal body P-ring protein FlgI
MDEELIEFKKRMDELLKQGKEFNDAVIIAIRNGDFPQVMRLSEVINSNITSQYKYIRTLIDKYSQKGDKSQSIFLMQNLKHLENIERLNIMATEAAKEYIRE